MSRITDIIIVLDNGDELNVPINKYTQAVRKQYSEHLPAEEIDPSELYRRIGFSLSVLESIKKEAE